MSSGKVNEPVSFIILKKLKITNYLKYLKVDFLH